MYRSIRSLFSPKRSTSRTFLFAAFAVAVVATGAASPHISWGHLPISPRAGQTLVISVDFLLLFFGFRLYIRGVRAEERERRRTEERLVSSYRYIGVANRKLEILTEFVERISDSDDPQHIREQIGRYLPEVACSLLGADGALLRIVNRRTGRTVTEWCHHADNDAGRRQVRIRNRRVLSGEEDRADGSFMHVDLPDGFATAAVIAADRSSADDSSVRFLKTMVRFLHLTFVYAESSRRPYNQVESDRTRGNGPLTTDISPQA